MTGALAPHGEIDYGSYDIQANVTKINWQLLTDKNSECCCIQSFFKLTVYFKVHVDCKLTIWLIFGLNPVMLQWYKKSYWLYRLLCRNLTSFTAAVCQFLFPYVCKRPLNCSSSIIMSTNSPTSLEREMYQTVTWHNFFWRVLSAVVSYKVNAVFTSSHLSPSAAPRGAVPATDERWGMHVTISWLMN